MNKVIVAKEILINLKIGVLIILLIVAYFLFLRYYKYQKIID